MPLRDFWHLILRTAQRLEERPPRILPVHSLLEGDEPLQGVDRRATLDRVVKEVHHVALAGRGNGPAAALNDLRRHHATSAMSAASAAIRSSIHRDCPSRSRIRSSGQSALTQSVWSACRRTYSAVSI